MTHLAPMQPCRACRIQFHSTRAIQQLRSGSVHRHGQGFYSAIPSSIAVKTAYLRLFRTTCYEKVLALGAWATELNLHIASRFKHVGESGTWSRATKASRRHGFSTARLSHVPTSPIASLVHWWPHRIASPRLASWWTLPGNPHSVCSVLRVQNPVIDTFSSPLQHISCSSEVHPDLASGVCELMYPSGAHAGPSGSRPTFRPPLFFALLALQRKMSVCDVSGQLSDPLIVE